MSVQPLTPDRFSPRPIDGLADLSVARTEFAQWLQGLGVEEEMVDDLLVVVSELGANAVRESAENSPLPTVAAAFDAARIEVEVANDVANEQHQTPKDGWDLDDPLRTGGRGLLVVSALVDEVEVEVEGCRLHVRCTVAVGDGQDDSTVT